MCRWARLRFFCLLIYLSAVQSADPPPFPKVEAMARRFRSSIELTSQTQKTTALAKEYYDFRDKTGRLDFMAFGIKSSYFIYGKSDQVYTVNDTACVENYGGVFDVGMGFYGWTLSDPAFLGPTALILMKEKDPPIFSGYQSARGINCSWYHWEKVEADQEVKLDYFFSVPDWDMPWYDIPARRPFPVRIKVSHIVKDDAQEEIIDYLYFRPVDEVVDKSEFQPPVGLGCKLKEPFVAVPFIPNQYTFSIEGLDLLRNTKSDDFDIVTATVWYDYDEKVARIEKYSPDGKFSEVHDFRAGVRYVMKNDRSCVIKTLRQSPFLKYDPDSFVGTMRDPREVMNLEGDDQTFYSMGQAEVRGIQCNVMEKVEHDVEIFDVTYKDLVTTAYLATASSKIQVDGEEIDFSPPLQIIITGYATPNNATFRFQYQVFSFDDEPGREFFWTYPSDECFSGSNQKSYFVILIPADVELIKQVEGYDTLFTPLARNTIINVANITEFRLPYLRADFRESGIYLTGLMLDRAPILAQFWTLFDEPTFVGNISAYKIDFDDSDEESCAAACLAYPEPCTGFHFCGRGCIINLAEITDTPVDPVPLNLNCSIYIRAVTDSKNDKYSLDQALQKLTKEAEDGKLKFSVRVKGETGLLPALKVVTGLTKGDDPSDYPYTLAKAGYQFVTDPDKFMEISDAQTEDDCYVQCKDSTSISCSSFSYCAKASNKMCRIATLIMDDNVKESDGIQKNDMCDIFSLLYLDFFDLYPGKVYGVNGEKTVDEGYSAEMCAKTCKEEKGFTCRGFEYCKSENKCVLHSKHVLDEQPGGSKTDKPECVHYAAKFVADYRDMGKKLIDDESNRRTSASLEQCARACSEEMPSCNSFNYCPPSEVGMPDSTCSLTVYRLNNAPQTKTKEKCRLYTKRDNIGDWSPPPPAKDKSGYTSGAFAGLIIGMIILGLTVGALLFVGYSYYRSRREGGDGLTVKFSRQENT